MRLGCLLHLCSISNCFVSTRFGFGFEITFNHLNMIRYAWLTIVSKIKISRRLWLPQPFTSACSSRRPRAVTFYPFLEHHLMGQSDRISAKVWTLALAESRRCRPLPAAAAYLSCSLGSSEAGALWSIFGLPGSSPSRCLLTCGTFCCVVWAGMLPGG